MISFKYLNQFLVASLLFTGQTFNMQAYDTDKVDTEIQRLRNNQEDTSIFDIADCDIEQSDLPKLIMQLTDEATGLSQNLREQIKSLNLNWNEFTSIPTPLLKLFPNTVNLFVSGNDLRKNLGSLLNIPSNVIELAIGWNDFTFLPRKIFTRLKNLKIILLAGNEQLRLSINTMEDLLKCTEIDLDSTAQENYINDIPTRQGFFNEENLEIAEEEEDEIEEFDEFDEQEKLEELDQQDGTEEQDLRIIKWLAKFQNTDKKLGLFIHDSLQIMINSYKNSEVVINGKYQPEIEKNCQLKLNLDEKIKQLEEERQQQKIKLIEQADNIKLLINTTNQLGFE